MTMLMTYSANPNSGFVSFDLAANGVRVQTLLQSYASPTRLDFYVTAPEQSQPIPANSFVKLYDTIGGVSTVIFYGIVTAITPGAHSNQVCYVVMDPTYIAGKSVTIMSIPYTSGGNVATGAVPRLVYNVKNTADADYSFSVSYNSTVAEILAGLFEYCQNALSIYGINGYVSADLTPMNFIPQEKVVWESVTFRAAIEQIYRHEPRFRMFFDPITQLMRFILLNNPTPGVGAYPTTPTPVTTLYMNDTGLTNPHPVIGADINPSFEDCCTAVTIFGPPNPGSATFTWNSTTGGTLTPVGSPIILQSYTDSMGTHNAQTYSSWQITDPTQRAGSRTLPVWENVPVGNYNSFGTRFPIFMASFDGAVTWQAVKGVWLDFLNGTATFENGQVPFLTITDSGAPATSGSTQTIFPPTDVKLVWAPYQAPLQVRYPATGYAGTAYTKLGIEYDYLLYDESLAIGYEYGTPVTSAEREAAYLIIAQYMQQVRCDIIYCGTVVLAGIDYSWLGLNRQACIANAIPTAMGGQLTGWEAMNSPVTDVEFDFGDNPSTTLTFCGNWLELYGEDPAALRERCRVQSFTQMTMSDYFGTPSITSVVSGGNTTVNINNGFVYVDQNNRFDVQTGSIR